MKLARIAVFAVAVGLTCTPSQALAQVGSSITGVVRDSSGGVLPGVTVEAASPALIEKVRSAVTDAEGLYRLVDLRPSSLWKSAESLFEESHVSVPPKAMVVREHQVRGSLLALFAVIRSQNGTPRDASTLGVRSG